MWYNFQRLFDPIDVIKESRPNIKSSCVDIRCDPFIDQNILFPPSALPWKLQNGHSSLNSFNEQASLSAHENVVDKATLDCGETDKFIDKSIFERVDHIPHLIPDIIAP